MRRLKKSLALLLALAMVLSTFAITGVSAQTFGDTNGHWAEALIDKWSGNGVINGYEDGAFRPDDYITRAELAKIISTAKNYTNMADIAFADVAGDEWYVSDLRKCVAQGVIGGYEDGTFRPDNYITREEASAMFVRAYNINATALLNFADSADVSEWAKTAVTALVGANVIGGYEDGTFRPGASITRAEVVKILDGAAQAEVLFPQATGTTSGTNSVGTIGNLGNMGGGSGGGGGGNQPSTSFNVAFNANGGKFSNNSAIKTINVGRNGVIGSRAEEPTRDGMLFAGWYTSIDAANELIESKKWDISSPVTRSMTLYAGWYIDGKVVVSFEVNGGTPAVPAQTIDAGSTAAEPSVQPTRAHYQFAGWYTKNIGGSRVNFDAKIKVNTRYYARWTVDADYASQEITLPDETTGSYRNGTIEAIPPSVIPGETVTFSITAPEGFEVDDIPAVKYISSSTGGEVEIDKAAVKYNEATNEYSFVMPSDVQNGSMSINPHYVTAVPTEKPLPPTPTVDPNAPTEKPVITEPPADMPTYYFSNEIFQKYSKDPQVPANKEIGGLTLSKAVDIDDNSKTFADSGYKYSRRLKLGTATLKFKVLGSCKILIDAASASSEDRSFSVKAGSTDLGTFDCKNGALPTAEINYTGGVAEITIAPAAGINVYGIDVKYTEPVQTLPPQATATAEPTPPPANPLVPQESAKAWLASDNFQVLYENSAKSSTVKFDIINDCNMNNLYLRKSSKLINYENMLDFGNTDEEYHVFSDGMTLPTEILNFRDSTEMEFIPSATKPGKLKLYYGGKAAGDSLVTVTQGDTISDGVVGETGDIVVVDVKAKETVKITSQANGWLFAVMYIPEGTTLEPIKPEEKQEYKATLNVTGAKDGAKLEDASAAVSVSAASDETWVESAEPAAEVVAAAEETWVASEAPTLGSSVNIGESLVLTFGREGDVQTVSVKEANVLTGVKEQATAFSFSKGQIGGNNKGGVIDESNPNEGELADGTKVTWTRAVSPSITDGVATVPNTGVFYKIEAKAAGSVVIKGKVGSGKEFAFMDATEPKFVTDSKSSTVYDPADRLTADLTTINVELEKDHTYYLVGMGTKMSLESISFTVGGTSTEPADPTTAPADPTSSPSETTKPTVNLSGTWDAKENQDSYNESVDPSPFTFGAVTMDPLPGNESEGWAYVGAGTKHPSYTDLGATAGNNAMITNKTVEFDENGIPTSGSCVKVNTTAKGVLSVDYLNINGKDALCVGVVKDGAYSEIEDTLTIEAGAEVSDEIGQSIVPCSVDIPVETGVDYYVYSRNKINFRKFVFIADGEETPSTTTEPDAANVYKFLNGTTVNYVGEAVTDGEVPTIVVTAEDGSSVAVNGTSFVMPAQDVTVTVTYGPMPTEEPKNQNEWTYDASLDGCPAGTELMSGLTTLFADKVDSKKYLTSDANGSFDGTAATGTALKYVASANGILSVGIKGLGTPGSSGNKVVYLVEEGGSQEAPIAKLENTSTTDKLDGEVKGAVEAGKTYYIYGAGTKACFVSALFTPAQ